MKVFDFLLYKGDIFCGVECKAAGTINNGYFAGLKELSEAN